jgi:DNA-binding transcriptional LysR family regulator
MTANLETGLLLTFVSVCETGSFTAAASRIGRSQSAVSLQIRRLEDMLGCVLLERTKRSVKITRSGQDFLTYARRILHLHAEAVAAVNPAMGHVTVRIGMPNDYTELYLPRVLNRFEQLFPDIHCNIQCDMTWELLTRMDAGKLDLVVGIRHTTYSSGHTLCIEDIVWVAGPDFDAGAALDRPLPLVLYPETCPYRARGIDALAGSGRQWHIVYTSQSPTGIRIAVEQRGAVSITSRRTVPAHWKILTPRDGFPALPPAELQLFTAPGGGDSRVVVCLADLFTTEFRT